MGNTKHYIKYKGKKMFMSSPKGYSARMKKKGLKWSNKKGDWVKI